MTGLSHNPTPAPPPSLSEHLLALSFAAGVTALLFSSTWGKVLFERDLLRFSYPGLTFLGQILRAGESPLWNPYLFCGYPFLAEMANAVLYPISLLLPLFPVPVALKLYPAVHYFLTGCLMWRLLREWGLEQAASLFGALCWMASGYLLSMYLNFNYLAPAAWYPALLFAGHRLLRTRRLGWLIAAALAWAMIFLAGDPQAFLFAGILLGLEAAAVRQSRTLPPARSLPLLSLTAGLACLVILAQFLPSLEFGAGCTKLAGFDFEHATRWSWHPLRGLEFIWPGLWGPNWPGEQFWGRFLRVQSQIPWAGAVYPGLFPLALALGQLRRFREPRTGFLILTLLLFFLLALGYYSPLYRLVWAAFPPYRIFRYPEKHLAVAAFALAGLAAFGFQELLAPESEATRRRFLRSWLILTGFLLAALLALRLGLGPLAQSLSDYLRAAESFAVSTYFIRASLLRAFIRAPVAASAFLVLWLCSRRIELVKRRLPSLLILLTALDLVSLGRGQFFAADPSLYALEPVASRIIRGAQAGQNDLFRIFRSNQLRVPVILTRPAGIPDPERLVFWSRDTLIPNLAEAEGFQNLYGYESAQLNRFRRFSAWSRPLLTFEMLNVKYLIDGLDQNKMPGTPELSEAGADPQLNLRVWRDRDCFPRAFFVDGARPARDDDQSLQFLDTTDFRRQLILLDRSRPEPLAGSTLIPARVQSYRNREVVIEITNQVPGHLVLADTYFPGWEAWVDGQPARILRANYLVRAVALDPGRHQVVFAYRPWPWRVGALASVVSLLLLALLLCRRSGLFPVAKTAPGPRSPG